MRLLFHDGKGEKEERGRRIKLWDLPFSDLAAPLIKGVVSSFSLITDCFCGV